MRKRIYVFIIAVFLVLYIPISPASAIDYTQIQWGNGTSGRLHLGESIAYMGYSVKAISFAGPVESDKYSGSPDEPVLPFVGLNISKNGVFINTTVLQQGESFITSDGSLRVTAKELPSKYSPEWAFETYNPSAVIVMNPRGTPNLEVTVDMGSSEYISTAEIYVRVTLKNTGTADAVNVDSKIETVLPLKNGSLKYHYERVAKGELITSSVTFSTPILEEIKSYSISANVSGFDVMGISYTDMSSKNISVKPEPIPIPKLRKSTNTKIYTKDIAMVSLSLKNNAKDDLKNVSIEDSLPENFKLVGNNSLKWLVDIPAFGEWNDRYLIKATKQYKDGILLPAASAEFSLRKEYYIIQSNTPEIFVNGPEIILNKSTDVVEIDPAGSITVTVSAENIGNVPTNVFINDSLPENAILLSGKTTHEEYLLANKMVSFSYTLKTEATQSFRLPPATAVYYELGLKGDKASTMSQELEIAIKSPAETTTNSPEITPETPTPETPLPTAGESDNSAGSNNVNVSDNPEPIKPYKKVEAILTMILGCNDNSTESSRPYSVYIACYFIGQNRSLGSFIIR